MAGSAYFMPASNSNGDKQDKQDKIRWNEYNKRQHEAKLRRLAEESAKRSKLAQQFSRNQILARAREGRNREIMANMNTNVGVSSGAMDVYAQREKIAMGVGQFAGVASGGQTFGPEQQALRQMFGHGESMWGFPESHGPDINNDLHPSLNGDTGTADIFGFGGRGQRSGLF